MTKAPNLFFNSIASERKPSRAFLREAKLLLDQEPTMRQALYLEALRALFSADFDLAHHLLRTLIHGTIGFEQLSKELNMPSKSLLRMFSACGNPTSKNLFQILKAIQRHQHMTLNVDIEIPRPKM